MITENEDFIEPNNQNKETGIPKKKKRNTLNKIKKYLKNKHSVNQKKKEKTSKTNYMDLNEVNNYCNEEKNNKLDVNFSIKNLSPPLSLKNYNKIENENTSKNRTIYKNKYENVEENSSQNKELINFEGNF